MGIWIRTQNKEVLLTCQTIGLTNDELSLVEEKNTESYLLGTYSTKERTLEVLDEIQNQIMNGIQSNNMREIANYEMESSTGYSVFEMPKE
ncbi:hypothetical protein EV204_105248 [Tissierella praeacuta]|uniref:hypothetical protein n=1 Tax=Tissierella praeacuta TaxID=43131 RepID=UPI001045CC6D|nr:hypothetical protein [Tissierella praeacuta]TCU72912.1 hypothetical protein EV204_105248 [Tissierella praeacuta]